MSKVDLKKELKYLYQPSTKEMIDGEGDPNTSAAYVEAVEALFSVSYTDEVHREKRIGRRAQVMHIGPFSGEVPTIEKVHQWAIDRKASRDLPERYPQDESGKVENHHQAADAVMPNPMPWAHEGYSSPMGSLGLSIAKSIRHKAQAMSSAFSMLPHFSLLAGAASTNL